MLMILLKSKREIELMKEAGRIVAVTHRVIKDAIKPGISTYELDKLAEKVIREHGATPSFKGYNGFKGSICASINNVVIHGIPSKKHILKEGDIISIDIGACYKGYHGDSAWTYAIGKISKEAKELLEITEQSLYKGLEKARVGNRIGDISHAIQSFVESKGYHVPKDYTGHGIGTNLHEDPIIPNFGPPNRGPRILKGMVLAIEPMVQIGTDETEVLLDNWTVVSQ